ncbi:hypothetical protein GGD65_000124 [Bradyrhizobium sp. CIR18]|nr:hypothetical protein [Bradyrhizobium sp. CIR18]
MGIGVQIGSTESVNLVHRNSRKFWPSGLVYCELAGTFRDATTLKLCFGVGEWKRSVKF